MNSTFFMPPVNFFGCGSVGEVGEKLKTLGAKKPLMVTDKGLVGCGIAGRVADHIKKAGLDVVIFDGTVPNPTDANCDEGIALYRKSGCDSIVSLGGGSSHDCAKGIGILVNNPGTIRDYNGVDLSKNSLPPFVAINTTSGTASEMTRFCIITNTETHMKMCICDWHVLPNYSINDPELMAGQSPALTAATGMDALTHAIEAYVSIIATPITDASALMAIDLIAKYLRKAVARGDNMEARDKMAYAQFLAGMAFSNASLGYVHAMAHQLGNVYNLPHGVCNAVLLPHVCAFNAPSAMEKYADVARHLGADVCGMSLRDQAFAGVEAIRRLSADIGIPAGLTAIGVKEADLRPMAEKAVLEAAALTNPKTATVDDVVAIFKAAM